MNINVTTSIDSDIYLLGKNNKIAWTDALEFGIKFLAAEKDLSDYPANSLSKKIESLALVLSEKLKEQEPEIPKEIKEVLEVK